MLVQQITLPELEALWNWPRRVSPHLKDVEEESLEWAASFGAFDPKTQRLVHDKGRLNLLAGMCYAPMTQEQVRTGCDIMHLFFMFDEYSDSSEPAEVWEQARIQMDAISNPDMPRPEGEWVGGEFTRQFWNRMPKNATETFKRRFMETWDLYTSAVARQAEYRSRSCVPDIASYFPVRRHTSGAPSTIALYELDLDIPDHIRKHPVIVELEELAVDLICIANDLLSYNKEQAVGDDEHNIVTILMKQFGLDVQGAIDEAGKLSDARMQRFYEIYPRIPRYTGPVDLEVQKLVDGMAQCVSGVMHWSYESQRYFGKRGLEIKASRTMSLLPKVKIHGDFGIVPIDDSKIASRT